jgi:hypothetical protein
VPVEDTCKFVNPCFGLDDVPMLAGEAVRPLVAFAWGAAGGLVHLGLTRDTAEVRRLARLDRWEARQNRPPDQLHEQGDLPPFVKRLSAAFPPNPLQ